MQIVIDIPEEIYKRFGYEYREANLISKHTNDIIIDAFCNGTPLPEHNGNLKDETDIIKSLFDYHKGIKTIGQCIESVPTIIPATKEDPIKQTKKEVNCLTCNFKWNCYKHGKLVNPCDAYIEQHEQIATKEGDRE